MKTLLLHYKTRLNKHLHNVVITSLLLGFAFFAFSGCEKNEAPNCTISSPASNSSFKSGQLVYISAQASDPESGLLKFELFVDGNKISETDNSKLEHELNTSGVGAGQHEIKAVATDNEGASGSDMIVINIDPIVLNKPASLGFYEKIEEIYLSWWCENATSYNIFWTDNGSDPDTNSNKIANLQDDYYTHSNLDPTKTYNYRIQAVNGIFTSPLSDMISATPKWAALPAPENVSASVSTLTATISWDAVNIAGATYTLYRKESTGYFSELATKLSNTQYTDNTLESGKGYYYKLRAHDDATSRTSEYSETCYAVTLKTIYETERNNQNITNSLNYDTHYWAAEDVTYHLDKYRIKGGYSAYSIYSAASYKNFEADCFNLNLQNGDVLEFKLISGNMSGLWSMDVGLRVYVKSTSGTYSDGEIYSFNSPSDSYTYNYSTSGTLMGVYLDISMWEDLINYGPYNYEVEITIKRNE